MAPSPTGFLHIGTARSTLFNYLFAKKNKGSFILRIEDTDLERSKPEYENDIIENLRWLGIDWDEGVDKGGDFGPYRQTERTAIFRQYLEKLLNSGKAFWCPHSEEFLEKESQKLSQKNQNPKHICEFRNKKAKAASNFQNAIIRFKTPSAKKICFDDLIHGKICFNSDDIGGDFSLAKNLNTPLYNFAVVIDDYEMAITHVIRGEDHISNTPKQILIYEALGLPIPKFAHLPLILGPDRTKLSKRHGDASVREYREAGYLPEALVNFTALLGWHPQGDKETFTLNELIKEFDFGRIQKGGAIFNIDKLNWLNNHYLKSLPLDDLFERAQPFLVKAGFELGKFGEEYVKKILDLERPRMEKLSDLIEKTGYFFKDPEFELELLIWKDMRFKEIITALNTAQGILESVPENNWTKAILEKNLLETTREAKNQDRGRLLWPLRVALTGLKASPSPFEILEILGKSESARRINKVLKKLG